MASAIDDSYFISTFGRSCSTKLYRGERCRILTPWINSCGYLEVHIMNGGLGQAVLVHREVALAFFPNPHNLPLVRHLNDIRQDNRATNLMWGTRQDNWDDARRNGITLGPRKRSVIGREEASGRSCTFHSLEDARRAGFAPTVVKQVCNRQRASYKGWLFWFADDQYAFTNFLAFTKHCPFCGELKSFASFIRENDDARKLMGICGHCMPVVERMRAERRRRDRREHDRKYYLKNREKRLKQIAEREIKNALPQPCYDDSLASFPTELE